MTDPITARLAEIDREASRGPYEPAAFVYRAHVKRLPRKKAKLREAALKVCDGFTNGKFVRSTVGDGESGWAVELFPYIRALALLEALRDTAPKAEG